MNECDENTSGLGVCMTKTSGSRAVQYLSQPLASFQKWNRSAHSDGCDIGVTNTLLAAWAFA